MVLNAGTTSSWEGSMAGAIEQAFLEEWPVLMKSAPPETNPQMKLLFLAVAKGIVRHLVANSDAFVIKLSGLDEGNSKAFVTVDIKSTEAP
jgi:hypothetical protein